MKLLYICTFFHFQYPFLKEIWDIYNSFVVNVNGSEYVEILPYCDNAPLLKSDTTGEYIKFCKKLSRNLLQIADGNYTGDKFMKYCDILYMWMYFELKKNRISNEITEKILKGSTQIIKNKLSKNPCPYLNFNEKHHEPTKLMILRIFNDNIVTFQNMLKGIIKSDECSVKRYVYKCIEIYRDMNSKYCSGIGGTTEEKENSCDIIRKFNNFYTPYIFKNNEITDKFPELSSAAPLNLNDICPLERRKSDSFPDETQQGTPTRGVSTALSAMFTPVRNLFRFGNKKHTIITSDFEKKMENELFHVINEDSNIKDIQPKYNIGYEAA
ncbi:hypothetical protein PVBG_04818 [Plasmodium vivax Brazil I]|uniref:VIR protein n=1 Tax=Plasmodium vivax (strain Brazil I) TaxID=1033975 RepID=A0A0J9T0F8_PLAV1|nr:hypothetical protein PVBG_04818 [Plasmodium vivax Brazil I]